MVEPKPGEPWPSLLKYGNASILPTKPPGPSKSTKRVPNTYQCFCMLNFVHLKRCAQRWKEKKDNNSGQMSCLIIVFFKKVNCRES